MPGRKINGPGRKINGLGHTGLKNKQAEKSKGLGKISMGLDIQGQNINWPGNVWLNKKAQLTQREARDSLGI